MGTHYRFDTTAFHATLKRACQSAADLPGRRPLTCMKRLALFTVRLAESAVRIAFRDEIAPDGAET